MSIFNQSRSGIPSSAKTHIYHSKVDYVEKVKMFDLSFVLNRKALYW